MNLTTWLRSTAAIAACTMCLAAPPPQNGSVMIPGGTLMRVRTIDPIDADISQPGMKFRAAMDDPVMVGGEVVIPRGSDVVLIATKVAQGGRMKGSDVLELKMNSVRVGDRVYPLVTSLSESKSAGEGKKTTRKILGGAGLGAAIGAIAGGGTGAAIGAAVGGGAGTIMAASGQPHLKVPSETRLQFQLLSDVKIKQ